MRSPIRFGADLKPLPSYKDVQWQYNYPIEVEFFADSLTKVTLLSSTSPLIDQALEEIQDGKPVSIDCEWTPEFYPVKHRRIIDLLQICTSKGVLIITIDDYTTPPSITRFLTSNQLFGKGCNQDCQKLSQLTGQSIRINDVERSLLNPNNITLNFISAVEQIVGTPSAEFKNKKISISNWSLRPLSALQILYSAFDAYAIYQLYTKMLTKTALYDYTLSQKTKFTPPFGTLPDSELIENINQLYTEYTKRNIHLLQTITEETRRILQFVYDHFILEPMTACPVCSSPFRSLRTVSEHIITAHPLAARDSTEITDERVSLLHALWSGNVTYDFDENTFYFLEEATELSEQQALKRAYELYSHVFLGSYFTTLRTEFDNALVLDKLSITKDIQGNYTCPICDQAFQVANTIICHYVKDHCTMVFINTNQQSKYVLSTKFLSKSASSPFSSVDISRGALTKAGLMHANKCSKCGAALKSFKSIKEHFRLAHLAFVPNMLED